MITAVAHILDGILLLTKSTVPHHKHHSIPIALEYLAEGGANVIFRIAAFAAASTIECPPELKGRLLRVRKDKPFIAPTQDQHHYFNKTISPLFDQRYLVQVSLISIDNALLVSINSELQDLQDDGIRDPSRDGEWVAEQEPHASLVTDMSPPSGAGFMLEFKPKWLLQSPDAPLQAMRCRTCALRARRARQSGVIKAGKHYCPLSLVSQHREALLQAARAIMSRKKVDHWMSDPAATFQTILSTPVRLVLDKLKDYQEQYGRQGILDNEPSDDYLLAMTLRDCTMFIRISDSLKLDQVEVRLADLDAKVATLDKVKRWRDIELELKQEGWYGNTERDGEKEVVCVLAKQQPQECPEL